jgi:hypothetical protein
MIAAAIADPIDRKTETISRVNTIQTTKFVFLYMDGKPFLNSSGEVDLFDPERSSTRPSTPHLGRPTDDAFVSTWTRASPSTPSSPPRNVTAGKPIIHSSARIGSVGGPPALVVEPPLRVCGSCCSHPAHFRSAPYYRLLGPTPGDQASFSPISSRTNGRSCRRPRNEPGSGSSQSAGFT